MYKTLFTVAFDSLFCGFCSFFACFCVANYFLPLKSSLIIAVLISVLFSIICLFILKSKRQTAFLDKKEQQLKCKIIDNLCFLPKRKQAEELSKAYRVNGETTTLFDGFFTTETEVIYANFSFRTLDKEDIASVKRSADDGKKIVLYGNTFDSDALETCALLNITAKNGDDVFALFKSTNYYPKMEIEVATNTFDFKSFIKGIFNKRNAKAYFLSGASLLFLSFLTPFKIYYVAFGTFLIILSIIAKFITPKN